jgi:hypothetical protein
MSIDFESLPRVIRPEGGVVVDRSGVEHLERWRIMIPPVPKCSPGRGIFDGEVSAEEARISFFRGDDNDRTCGPLR